MEEWEKALFDVQRSARYHDRRTSFYERLHQMTAFITVLLAGFVITDPLREETPLLLQCLATMGALFSAVDLVVGFSRKADLHRKLRIDWVNLERRMNLSSHDLSAVLDARLEIETRELPVYRALDLLCHNELVKAKFPPKQAAAELLDLGWPQRWTANFYKWPDI